MPVYWTPETSVMGIGQVTMPRRPDKAMTRNQYEGLLEERIRAMVERHDPETLQQTMLMAWENEGLDWDRPEQIPRLLVGHSQALRRMSGLTTEAWPVPQDRIKVTRERDPEPDLRDLLLMLYPGE